MQRLCPGPKPYDKCSLCDVVLVHTKGPDCNVSKAQWTSKRHGDRLCFDCVANKRARCCPSKAEADGGGKGQEAVVGAGKVAGGVVAGGIWRADLEARRGYHSLQVPRSKVLPSLRTFYQKITDNVLLLWTGACSPEALCYDRPCAVIGLFFYSVS